MKSVECCGSKNWVDAVLFWTGQLYSYALLVCVGFLARRLVMTHISSCLKVELDENRYVDGVDSTEMFMKA